MALEEAYQEVERQFEIDLLPEQKQTLMKDQTDRLNNLGIPAISLVDVDDPDIIQQVIDGFFCEKLVR
ncbi:hypothetical protein AC249_AIPGENE10263 [Exaiptasia diaphana]|nr:hypothetical protein AC249_AIPGENE10263 [Exaiptasia diaphana]